MPFEKNFVVAIVGAGPAGLMAAETLVRQGLRVQVYEAKPSVGRKFLMAGRGGLNITHSESADKFVTRYGARAPEMGRMLEQFDAEALRAWVHALGIETFVGSSGRVFPDEMKAAPLLRAWMHRLRVEGVHFFMRHRWLGWDDAHQLRFDTPNGEITIAPDATVLALGGGSWAKLGSDGAWWPWLKEQGVPLSPLLPSNGGFETKWSTHFLEKCAGEPIKPATFRLEGSKAAPLRGECMVTQHGLEGGAIYALSAALRNLIINRGKATLILDLLPDHSPQRVLDEVSRARGTRSMSSHLRTRLGLQGVRAALLRERLSLDVFNDPQKLAFGIKNLPIVLHACRPIDEAISTAGGVQFEGLTEHGMLKNLPGVFCAGEMLDWEAPTGGYLLNGVMASGQATAKGLLNWLATRS
ncbi:TIGR03862 family flavoprotein [Zwartia sp.]|uniref:TIGR03862 family flavoprotein n=1 Tax=Zwartia sp. TaxID=2978004 RepID=UPI0027285D77|nr:TIGR03862 family flavoprotein [Zwartia sp.]MDO9023567.1 TIGR03862 family flavoprotein [Zwartia sp.]